MNSRSVRELVIEYLGGECMYCGSTEQLDIHHILPLYAGGRNSMANVEPVCVDCHAKLHTQLIKLYPAATQVKGHSRVAKAYSEIAYDDKVGAADAMMELVELGIISEDTVPDELKDMLGSLQSTKHCLLD